MTNIQSHIQDLDFSKQDLIEASGIEQSDGFRELDVAVPTGFPSGVTIYSNSFPNGLPITNGMLAILAVERIKSKLPKVASYQLEDMTDDNYKMIVQYHKCEEIINQDS
jgi:hypothetical protein